MISNASDLKQAAVIHTLANSQLFRGVPSADLVNIAQITSVKRLAKGEYLFREQQTCQGFFIIQKGSVYLHRVTEDGKEQVVHIFRTGDTFAEASLVMDSGYPADAKALEDSQVLMVQKEGFTALFKQKPELALRMLTSMSMHLKTLLAQLQDLTLRDVETRLASWLIKRVPDPESASPVEIHLTSTKRILAAELGTISETLSRTLAKFREAGLATSRGKIIRVESPAKLQAFLKTASNS